MNRYLSGVKLLGKSELQIGVLVSFSVGDPELFAGSGSSPPDPDLDPDPALVMYIYQVIVSKKMFITNFFYKLS